jgi:hypothetical protein
VRIACIGLHASEICLAVNGLPVINHESKDCTSCTMSSSGLACRQTMRDKREYSQASSFACVIYSNGNGSKHIINTQAVRRPLTNTSTCSPCCNAGRACLSCLLIAYPANVVGEATTNAYSLLVIANANTVQDGGVTPPLC